MSYSDEWQNENNEPQEEAPSPSAEEITPAAEESEASREPYEPQDSLVYGPEDQYTPRRESYTPYSAEKAAPSKKGTVGKTLLCSFLALVLLVGTFFGGTVVGRFFVPAQTLTPGANDGSTTPGGNGTPPSNIIRGELTLNLVERVAGLSEEGSVPAVVEAVQHTVVEIRTETAVNDPFNGNYVESGAGSGVIIDESGAILTCNHVIEGASNIVVTLFDGSEYTATLLGGDSWSDLALIKIEGEGFPAATMCRAPAGADTYSYMKVGETAVAIGNPLGELGGSVSRGIISALGREVKVDGIPMTLLQIDASVNPGNSGGGLFNLRGELIGIVNAKSTGDAIEGIGFAIPSVDAIDILAQLQTQGYVSGRPYLGLQFSTGTNGVLQIVSYDFNSELTGGHTIQNGDYLQYMDGIEITNINSVRTILAGKKPGDTVTVSLLRRANTMGYYTRYETLEFTLTVHEYIPASYS